MYLDKYYCKNTIINKSKGNKREREKNPYLVN